MQWCNQVAGDSWVLGRGLCPFLVTRPVRTLNSSPVPRHACLGGASDCGQKPVSIWMPAMSGSVGWQMVRASFVPVPLLLLQGTVYVGHPTLSMTPFLVVPCPSSVSLHCPHTTWPLSQGIYYMLHTNLYACLSPLGQKLMRVRVGSSFFLSLQPLASGLA